MRQRMIFILKHNAFIQKLYRVVMSFAFKALGVFLKEDENLVLFVSFMGMGFNDSPKAIYDYMKNDPGFREYKCIWAFERPEKFPELQTVRKGQVLDYQYKHRTRIDV